MTRKENAPAGTEASIEPNLPNHSSPQSSAQPAPLQSSLFVSLTATAPVAVAAFTEMLERQDLRSSVKSGYLWSPAIFNGTRSVQNVVSVGALVFDGDAGRFDRARFAGVMAVSHDTHSSSPQAQKERLILCLSRRVTAAEYQRLWPLVRERYAPSADGQCKDAARAYYLPPSGALLALHTGSLLDVDALLTQAPAALERADAGLALPPPPSARQDASRDAEVAQALASVWQPQTAGDRAFGGLGGWLCKAGVSAQRAAAIAQTVAQMTQSTHADPVKRALQAYHGKHLLGWTALREALEINGGGLPDSGDLNRFSLRVSSALEHAGELLRLSVDTPAPLPAAPPAPSVCTAPTPQLQAAPKPVEVAPPLAALPRWVADHAEAAREALRSPLDLNFVNALGALSAAVQGNLIVQVDAGHVEQTCLYSCVVLPPGASKSPAATKALGPIIGWERQQREAKKLDVERRRQDRQQLEREKKKLERDLEKQSLEAMQHEAKYVEARDRLADIAVALTKPKPEHFEFILQNATPEAIHAKLSTHGRIAVFHDDAAALFRILMGGYSDGSADLSPLLMAYDGAIAKVTRIGRDVQDNEHERHTASAMLAIQPSVLEKVVAHPDLTGQGLCARFCWIVPTLSGVRWSKGEKPTPIPPHVEAAYATGLQRMLSLQPVAARLSSDAEAAYLAWRDELEARLQPDGDLSGDLRGWTSKHWDRTARIAGLLWAAEGAAGDITGEQMQRAVLIGRWLVAHALKALGGFVTPEHEQRIIDLCKTPRALRYLLRMGPGPLRTSKALLPVLADLVARGQLGLTAEGSYVAP